MSEEWREGYIKPPEGGGIPPRFKLRLARFAQGCEVCGVMNWFALPSGEMGCGSCGNVFDTPVIEENAPDGPGEPTGTDT